MGGLLRKINLPHHASRLLKPLADLFTTLRGRSVAIGLSGGADSAMLAVCAAELAAEYDVVLHCVHIHHGLMAEADNWQRHCQQLVELLSQKCPSRIIFAPIAVHVDKQSGLGVEGAAREARYQAFLNYAHQQGISHFLIAHHLNDQAETVLLRLLRGSGVKGMQGMKVSGVRHIQHIDGENHLSLENEVFFHRPWLNVERESILSLAQWFADTTQWEAVQDESNLDLKYKRGVIRQHLTPVLNQYWHHWQYNLARHARLMEEAQQMIDDLAALDFKQLMPSEDNRSFCLKAWRALPSYRQNYVLRYWLGLFRIAMPTERRLQEWIRQLREVHQLGTDRDVRLPHEGYQIRLKKGRVILVIAE